MTYIDKSRVRESFGQAASTYDRYARVQKIMACELMEKITAVRRDFKNILEIGCGTGFLTELLAQKFPRANILAIDISPQMIEVARRKLACCPKVKYLVGDGENLRVDGCFDLIVSSAVFQWFNTYLRPFAHYHRILEAEGHFLFNTFGKRTLEELGQVLETLGMGTPKQEFIDSAKLHRVLQKSGFPRWSVEERFFKVYYPSIRELLISIKKIGAQGRNFKGMTFLKGGDVFKLAKLYNIRFGCENKVYASYHVLYGHAFKSEQARR